MHKPDWTKTIFHIGTKDYLSDVNPCLNSTIYVTLRSSKTAPIEQIVLRTIPNGEQQFTLMHKTYANESYQFWQAPLRISEICTNYRFGIQSLDGIWWYNGCGIGLQEPFSLFDFKIIADFQKIDWLEEAVFYQIFPDRFANGDASNDPRSERLPYRNFMRETYAWGESPDSHDRYTIPFYGGDLKGIADNVAYLQELGVNALYLNPVFKAYSNHRYDVIDYETVDPVLGGNDSLIALAKSLKQNEMHYILDIVPNHCGIGHHWFQKAIQEPESEEAGFFYFYEYPNNYVSWLGHDLLPKLNYSSALLQKKMYLGENSILRKWLKPPFSADGWRVDVANMLGRNDAEQLDQQVIPAMRNAVKSENKDAYLMGENFFEATAQLQGNGWDGVMNYKGFCMPLWNWLFLYEQDAYGLDGVLKSQLKWPAEIVVNSWKDSLASIPWQIATQQFNILDSHDTPRIRTLLEGNDTYHRLAAIVQFTFPGVPCIYYGDEIGILDSDFLGSRNCMDWKRDTWDQDLFGFYQKLIAIRKDCEALKTGGFQVLYNEDDLIIYHRFLGKEDVIISANRSIQVRSGLAIEIKPSGLTNNRIFKAKFSDQVIETRDNLIIFPPLKQGADIWMEG